MMPFCNPTKINLFDNPAAIKSKNFWEKMKYMFWWECFECFFCKNMFCPHWKYEQRFAFSSLGKSDQSSVHVHDWISFKKVTKVPLMNVNWTWIERKKFSSYNALILILTRLFTSDPIFELGFQLDPIPRYSEWGWALLLLLVVLYGV